MQRDGLMLLQQLLVDAVKAGLGTVDKKRAVKLVEQARQMNDAYLPGAAERLRRLAVLAAGDDIADDDAYYQLREPGFDLPDALRHRLMVRHLTRLWAMVRRGQKYLEDKLEEGESQGEADAVVEELLGRVFRLEDLRERGSVKRDMQLFELAYERYDDRVREERIEQSWLLDLGDGSIYVDRALRPFAALDRTKEKESFDRPLLVGEAGIYPGFVNRRIRWEVAARRSRAIEASDFDRVHSVAHATVEAALPGYKEQIRNPLAPDDAVVLVRAREIRRAGQHLFLVDPGGGKLVLRDSEIARYRSLRNLEMAAGAALRPNGELEQPACLLLRLFLGLADDLMYAQPLSIVVATRHVRLGM